MNDEGRDDAIFISFEAVSDAKVLIISIAARLAGMHPQTLRQYDRMGWCSPAALPAAAAATASATWRCCGRCSGSARKRASTSPASSGSSSSKALVSDLRQRVADLEDELIRTRTRLAHLESTGFPRRDLVPTHQHQTALVVWRPSQK